MKKISVQKQLAVQPIKQKIDKERAQQELLKNAEHRKKIATFK